MQSTMRICPVCNIDLQRAQRQGVEIDYCPQCRGIWLDRGELEKLIERSGSEFHDDQDGYSAGNQYREDYGRGEGGHHGRSSGREHGRGHDRGYGGEHGGRRERRGGFLGDLFDF
mgnify:CR=1 FL=1